jgi:hypothetical protein
MSRQRHLAVRMELESRHPGQAVVGVAVEAYLGAEDLAAYRCRSQEGTGPVGFGRIGKTSCSTV